MKHSREVILSSLLLLVASGGWAKEIRIPRQPDYHNGKIAFSYLGSIWVVNEDGTNARRLTVNAARDTFPRFSPDGKWIAFSSNRYGNNDVFVMPAEGGEPKQLTYNSANDTVVGWSRDSKYVIFNSARGRVYPGVLSLYRVPAGGGLEEPLDGDWGYWGSYSADGSKFVFNRHSPTWWRKHYRGSYAADLWVEDIKAKSFKKILDTDVPDETKANNTWPLYGNGEIYFVSDRETNAKAGSREVMKSANNLWKIGESGGKAAQITHFHDGSLFFPSISSDGKVIVFEEDFGLWKLDTGTGKASEVKIDATSDDKENNFEAMHINAEADSYGLSPSGQRAAISAHGEIFTIATERGDVTRVTHSYSRETAPVWSPDGKWIAYLSDEGGKDSVWVADAEGNNAKKLTDTDNEKLSLKWMPDSKAVYFTSSDHGLYDVEVAGGQPRKIAGNDAGNIAGADVSPDGKWFAYAKQDRDLREHVYIISAQGGEEHQLNDDLLFSTLGPRWTADGKKLIFLGGYVQGGSATLRENAAALYGVSLAEEEKDPMSRDVDSEAAAEAAERTATPRGGRGGGANADARPVEVKIEFGGLQRRIHKITRLSDNIVTAAASPDSKTYAFVAVGDAEGRPVSMLYTIGADGEGLRQLTQSMPPAEGGAPGGGFGMGAISELQFSHDGRELYFLERQNIWAIGVGAGSEEGGARAARGAGASGGGGTASATRRKVNFQVKVEVDHRAERKEVFEQAWRVMRDRFYDKGMNGADWTKYRGVYEPLLEDVGDREEMQNIIMQMIGELNASHTGVSGGEQNSEAMQTRYPGFELEADSSGYYKVAFVYKDGPADHDYVRIHPGDYILAVNGEALHAGDNYWRNYDLAPGRKMEFTVNSKPAADGAWTTRVEPVSSAAHATLQYDRWVEERRAMVEKMTNGEIGYLHIRQMNAEALHKFERDLADNHFKKALVIDQRFNPGGGIDQELLEILEQHQYQYTRGRDSVYITRPQRAFFGPIVVMQNERSFSDAEVFPDGVRRLGLGKTVGVNTNGSVIGTGAFRLMDGSTVRTPGTGLWDTSGQNLENYGVPADVYVDNTPGDFLAGRDAQLEKAIQVLQDELKKNPPKDIPGR
ncbi:MAG TPA: S41 family peptidase [Candidatus Methylomirabilis sp.]|nr:S41 family peptidase [Candidatus Methylomirabilis sp.]